MERYCHIPTHELLSPRWMTILWTTTKNYWIYKKPHTYTKHWRTTMNPWLWRHLHFIFKQFSRRKLTHQLLGPTPSFIHELEISVIKFIEEIFFWLDKHAVIQFTLTLTSCPFQIYLAESRMVGIQRVVRFRKGLVIH